jgi:hypothetical protein
VRFSRWRSDEELISHFSLSFKRPYYLPHGPLTPLVPIKTILRYKDATYFCMKSTWKLPGPAYPSGKYHSSVPSSPNQTYGPSAQQPRAQCKQREISDCHYSGEQRQHSTNARFRAYVTCARGPPDHEASLSVNTWWSPGIRARAHERHLFVGGGVAILWHACYLQGKKSILIFVINCFDEFISCLICCNWGPRLIKLLIRVDR